VTLPLDSTLDSDSAKLAKQLMRAHWRHSSAGEIAATDQIHSYLTPVDTRDDRSMAITLGAVMFGAEALHKLALLRGYHNPRNWALTRIEGAHRVDPSLHERVISAVDVSLKLPGDAQAMVYDLLAGADVDAALAVVREAVALASALAECCLLAS